MKKMILFLSLLISIMPLSIISAEKKFTNYKNATIKTVSYPFRQFWNSSRLTKITIGAISVGGALFLFHKPDTTEKGWFSWFFIGRRGNTVLHEIAQSLTALERTIDEMKRRLQIEKTTKNNLSNAFNFSILKEKATNLIIHIKQLRAVPLLWLHLVLYPTHRALFFQSKKSLQNFTKSLEGLLQEFSKPNFS